MIRSSEESVNAESLDKEGKNLNELGINVSVVK
jgi:hypothetical protein